MKILIPFRRFANSSFGIDSDVVVGGTERFIMQLQRFYDEAEIRVFDYYDEDVANRKVAHRVAEAALDFQPDLIISNLATTSLTINVQRLLPKIPVLCIIHVMADSHSATSFLKKVGEFYENGGTIAMVSECQKANWKKFALRQGFPELNVAGFISPSFIEARIKVPTSNRPFDLVTIGRADHYKDPWNLSRRIASCNKKNGTSLRGIVSTNDITIEKEYWDEQYPRWSDSTVLNYSQNENKGLLDKSKVYLSTLSRETWGTTVMEAYSRGVPCLIHCTGEMIHASESILNEPTFFRKIRKSYSNDEFLQAFYEIADIPIHSRQELADRAFEENNRRTFCNKIKTVIEKTLDNFNLCKKETQSHSLQSFL